MQDTAHKVSQMGAAIGYPIVCVGIPKTIDNDLPITDCCPGFGSVAKYVATSIREAAFDLASMSRTSTKVFALEVMGRHAGWMTAACALAVQQEGDAPHILLLPEIAFDEARFLAKVEQAIEQHGHCVIAVSEGVKGPDGEFLSASDSKDPFGHAQLGGVAPFLTKLIAAKLVCKCHWAVPDYLQRSARHIASESISAGLGSRSRGGGIRNRREKRGDAGDPPAQRLALSLGHYRGAALRGRQPGEAFACRLYQRRRLRHHTGGTPVFGAPHHWRSLSAI